MRPSGYICSAAYPVQRIACEVMSKPSRLGPARLAAWTEDVRQGLLRTCKIFIDWSLFRTVRAATYGAFSLAHSRPKGRA